MQKQHKNFSNKKNGMTSIELVVVFGIFALLATSVLFNYREFSTGIKLKNLAQDIALQIRQAQNRAVSGTFPPLMNDAQEGPSSNWTPSYGLYFSREEGFNKRFVLFFDNNTSAISNPNTQNFGDYQISSGDINCSPSQTSTECFDSIQITTGEYIDSICLDEFIYGTCEPVDDVHIVFTRPLNRAVISYTGMQEDDFVSDASIYIKSVAGSLAIVRITSTGQIIVE